MTNYLKPLLFKVSDFTYKINKMIPKKRNRIVLYSNWGFRDNLRTLYHYLVDYGYQESYEIVCASNDFYHLEKEHDVKYVSNKSGCGAIQASRKMTSERYKQAFELLRRKLKNGFNSAQ